LENINPVTNTTLPYWRPELHKIDSYRSSEILPEESDIVIIGAGISGVSTAYHFLNDTRVRLHCALGSKTDMFWGHGEELFVLL
jgi:hypothetical protein